MIQTNELIQARKKRFLRRELFITRIKRIFTELEKADRKYLNQMQI